jgi:hypothetical protein
MAVPTDEQIKLVRDAYLEAYIRRNPVAQPEPGTSLYAILEATGAILAAVIAAVPEAEESIYDFLEADRNSVLQPDPDPRAFERLERVTDRDERGEPIGTEPNPDRQYDPGDEWPCKRRAEGSF